MSEFVFVYGTLMKDEVLYRRLRFWRWTEFVDFGRVRGRLYRVSWFPAAVPSDSAGWVLGELYRLRDPQYLRLLDRVEGYRRDDEAGSHFVRRRIDVHLESGAEHRAWIYFYNRSVAGLGRIASGSFRDLREALPK